MYKNKYLPTDLLLVEWSIAMQDCITHGGGQVRLIREPEALITLDGLKSNDQVAQAYQRRVPAARVGGVTGWFGCLIESGPK